MEAPLKDWEAGSHWQQSASTAASSTQTHILHSRIYCFPDSQCHRDSRHYFSLYPVNISWVLRLKQIFLSSSSALFIILIKKYSRCVLSWVFPSHMHGNLFPAMSRQWAGPKDTTHPYVFKALCMIHLHLLKCARWPA